MPRRWGDELASIIILCCNELDYNRQCLESVLQHTRGPYELILVDNGSTDGTSEYLKEIQGKAEPARVIIMRNEKNVGFPAGCNQGLTKARGRYLVFLNNDTIVTNGWLEGLIASLVHWDDMYNIPSTPLTCCSMGAATGSTSSRWRMKLNVPLV